MLQLNDISTTAALLDARGWAESGSCNISCRIISDTIIPFDDYYSSGVVRLEPGMPELAGQILLITGSGARMRDAARDPISQLAALRISNDGAECATVRATDGKFHRRPSSELPTHLALHARLARNRRSETAIVHAHSTEIVAITHHPDYADEETLNRLIWSMHPEAALFLPDGVGLLPYMPSGDKHIAAATADALGTRKLIIWRKHGIVAVGDTCEAAFDLIDVVAKAVRMYFVCRSAGFSPEGLTLEQIEALRGGVGSGEWEVGSG